MEIQIIRCLLLLFTAIMAYTCKPPEQPVLMGTLWGGEGARLTVTQALDNNTVIDTLLIDNMGEFKWLPNSLTAGFYRISDVHGNCAVLLLEQDKTVMLDGQYSLFPQFVSTNNTALFKSIIEIEKNTGEWADEITVLSAYIDSVNGKITIEEMDALRNRFDSIQVVYQAKALATAVEPLAQMFALMQQAGNNPLFSPWPARELFFETDRQLKPFAHLEEVKKFSILVEQLKEMQRKFNRTSTGSLFPQLVFTDTGDTVDVTDYKGIPAYIEIRLSTDKFVDATIAQYSRQVLAACIVMLHSGSETVKLVDEYAALPHIVADSTKNTAVINQLGIMQYPANFLINDAGIIVAKNIWGNELKQTLETMLIRQ